MLISETKRFAFVHFYRTGGTWLTSVLQKFAPAHWLLKQHGHPHDRAYHAPAGYKVFAFVRNPWDWYVSNYFFYRQHWQDKTGGYLLPSERWIVPERDFAEMFSRSKVGDGFAENIADVIQGKYVHTQMLRTFNRLVRSGSNELRIGKFENLRTDAGKLIAWASAERVTDDLAHALTLKAPANTARHKPYQTYYCPALRDLVSKCDKELIDEFGYNF